MKYVWDILTANVTLTLSIGSWVVAQVLKFVVVLLVQRKVVWRYLWTGGGMPSSHSSLVTACATAVGLQYGWSSPLFALSAVFAIIVMYDASHVRKAAGEQARVLNYMMQNWGKMKPEIFANELKELLGHTPLQVLAGAVLGVLIGVFGLRLLT
ncbi:MAG: divergent PAP2 family protein [Oscillospiraceae bacterium]|nr:divergent PAP2 family protein [Oscillospiraceae bacterium]